MSAPYNTDTFARTKSFYLQWIFSDLAPQAEIKSRYQNLDRRLTVSQTANYSKNYFLHILKTLIKEWQLSDSGHICRIMKDFPECALQLRASKHNKSMLHMDSYNFFNGAKIVWLRLAIKIATKLFLPLCLSSRKPWISSNSTSVTWETKLWCHLFEPSSKFCYKKMGIKQTICGWHMNKISQPPVVSAKRKQ